MQCTSRWFSHSQAVFLVDTKGLITDARGDEESEHKPYVMLSDGTPDMKVWRVLPLGPKYAFRLSKQSDQQFHPDAAAGAAAARCCSLPDWQRL